MTAFQRIRNKSEKRRPPRRPDVQSGEPILLGGTHRTRLERLFHESPLCHWCARETILRGPEARMGKLPKLAATLDHIYSRINPAHRGNRHLVVLACNSCNLQRARDEAAILQAKRSLPGRYAILRLIGQSCVL